MLMANYICSVPGNATVASCERTLHLVDADNLLGDPNTVDRGLIRSVFAQYRRAAGYRAGDQVVVATGRNGLHVFEVEAAWPGVLHRRRSGEGGADLELLDEAYWASRSGRFGRVVIGLGDRIFMTAVDVLRLSNVAVDVVARRESLATCLALQTRGPVFVLDGSGEIRPSAARFRRPRRLSNPLSRLGPLAPMTSEVEPNSRVELMASA
jgi:hypothetical protein